MNFRNLTPFSAQCFESVDAHQRHFFTIVTRIGYRIAVDRQGNVRLDLMDDAPVPLALEDAYEAAPHASSPRAESDLAPFKPACDVLVRAVAYAPRGVPATQFPVRLEMLSAERPPQPEDTSVPDEFLDDEIRYANHSWRPKPKVETLAANSLKPITLIDKTLSITGERTYRKNDWHALAKVSSLGLADSSAWEPTPPEPCLSLPLRYEYAYGGECRIDADDPAAERVPKAMRLSTKPQAGRAIAHAICEENPVGCGFSQNWYLHARKPDQIPAPRIAYADHPIDANTFCQSLKAPESLDRTRLIAGFGPLGRSWRPRSDAAGTYDQSWLKTQHPLPPHDFDTRYWNCAPQDQQIVFPNLAVNRTFKLRTSNLLAADAPATRRDRAGNTVQDFELPHHTAFVLTRWEHGLLLPYPMNLDTVSIDLIEGRVDLVWRLQLPADLPIRVAELRFNLDPAAPLMPMPQAIAEIAHG